MPNPHGVEQQFISVRIGLYPPRCGQSVDRLHIVVPAPAAAILHLYLRETGLGQSVGGSDLESKNVEILNKV